MHKSVYRRFAAEPVVLFDTTGRYRPQNMSVHVDFAQYYDPNAKDPQPADPPQAIAFDIETLWERHLEAGKITIPGSILRPQPFRQALWRV
jgi:hypothetical protein